MNESAKLCLGCTQPLPDPFLDLGTTPLANSYLPVAEALESEPVYPLAVAYCPHCHLVQLTKIVPPASLFSHYLYFSSYSESYLQHARQMASSLRDRFSLTSASRVVEIASNDGYLLQYFRQFDIPVRGVEPAANIAAHAIDAGIPTYVRFFDGAAVDLIREDFGAPDLIIGNNVLAHVPQVNDFLLSVAACLGPSGSAVFEVPHLLPLLEHVEFDTIYHEHVFYYSLTALQQLARRAGMELYDVEPQSVHGGSLRISLQRESVRPVSPAVTAMLEAERSAGLTSSARYAAFSRQVQEVRAELVGMLTRIRAAGGRVAAYGAPAKGNTLLNYCGISTDLIEFTVDRSPHKQGMLLPGSRIPIHEPDRLESEMPEYALILPWNLASEIIEQREYSRRGGRFILPIPHPRVLESPLADVAEARIANRSQVAGH